MTWMLFWKIMFVLVMAVFAVMSILVTVLGARDIRRLLSGLKDDASADADPSRPRPEVDGDGRE